MKGSQTTLKASIKKSQGLRQWGFHIEGWGACWLSQPSLCPLHMKRRLMATPCPLQRYQVPSQKFWAEVDAAVTSTREDHGGIWQSLFCTGGTQSQHWGTKDNVHVHATRVSQGHRAGTGPGAEPRFSLHQTCALVVYWTKPCPDSPHVSLLFIFSWLKINPQLSEHFLPAPCDSDFTN